MNEPSSLFRREALEYHVGGGGGDELAGELGRWIDFVYWGLLALVALGLVASFLIRVHGEPLLFALLPALKGAWLTARG